VTAVRIVQYIGTAAAWNDFSQTVPGFTHCHLHTWGDIFAGTFGHPVHRLAAI